MTKGMTTEEIMELDDDAISGMVQPPVIVDRRGNDANEGDIDGQGETQANEQEDKTENQDEDQEADGAPGSDAADEASQSDDQMENAEDDGGASDDDQPDDSADRKKSKADPKSVSQKAKPEDDAAGADADAQQNRDNKSDGEGDADPKAEKPESGEEVDYKSAYERIMAPFKANGKMIKIDSPDEAIQLMQMGANYTRKIQALQPGLKVLRMLENNGLLDETKLSFLIDLSRKDPAAVKKLVKESGVDPMDIDTSKDSGYKPGNYQVSDEEVALTSLIRDIGSEQGGRDLIQSIHKTWDKRSKDAILADPEILRVLNDQRTNGIYAKVSAEIERRKTIGRFSSNTPFLEAYRVVGEEMQRSGALTVPAANPQAKQPNSGARHQAPANNGGNSNGGNRRVVDQRVAQRKPSGASNVSDRVRAASAAPAIAGKPGGKDAFNPLAISDEEFNKVFAAGKRY